MKVKKVNQYQCDFCGKKNYSAGHMKSHEKHCTMNPERACRMCAVVGVSPSPMTELLAMLPEPEWHPDDLGFETFVNIKEINEAIDALQEKVRDCPACTLAAIRQKGILVPITKFDYTSATKGFWNDFNDAQAEEDERYYFSQGG
jgi:hypothetical protein